MIEKIIEAGMQGIDMLKINGDEIHSKQNTVSEISKKETAEIADSKAKIADIPDTEMIANTSIETIFENIRKQFENSAIGKNAENVEFSDKKSDHTTVRQINPNNAFDNSEIYNITQIEKNKLDGCKREENVEKDLEKDSAGGFGKIKAFFASIVDWLKQFFAKIAGVFSRIGK